MPASELHRKLSIMYSSDRAEAALTSQRRRTEAYAKLPRLQAIETEIQTLGFALSNLILESPSGSVMGVAANIRTNIQNLADERASLLATLGLTLSYFTDVHKCMLCKDTGYLESAPSTRCKCFKQKQIQIFYGASLPPQNNNETFKNFEFGFYSQKQSQGQSSPYQNISAIYNEVKDFAENFPSTSTNLFLYGNAGLGKTFLCKAINHTTREAGHMVLYAPSSELFRRVEAMRFSRDEYTQQDAALQIQLLYDAELLIIDDLGSEFSTIVTSSELFNILNSRLVAGRSTVISTNLSLSNFQNTYSERVYSRVIGNFKILKFFGEDIRIQLASRM